MHIACSIPTAAAFAAASVIATAAVAQDTLVVRADNSPLWGQEVQLSEEIRIGMLDGPDEYLFGRIGSVAVGLDGMIFVYDGHVPVIRQYDSTGMYLKDVGREGAGPGEYRRVLGMRVLSDGGLAIWDAGNGRITVYDPRGDYVDDHLVPSGLFAADVFFIDTAGSFYVKASDRSRRGGQVARRERNGGPVVVTGPIAHLLIKVSAKGEITDSIRLPMEESGSAFVLATPEGYRGPFAEDRCYTWSLLGYVVTGENTRYAIDLELPDGTIRRIERRYEAVRVEQGERSQWEAWADFFARRPGAERFGPIPERKPAFRALSVDDDGRIWVDRYTRATKHDAPPRESGNETPPYLWRETPTFDVIDPLGEFLGTVSLPARSRLAVSRGVQVWGVQRGEFDEQYVVRWRIGTRGTP